MKISIVNTYLFGGGAAVASRRLFEALRLHKENRLEFVSISTQSRSRRFWHKLCFWLERILFIIRAQSKDEWFKFSIGNTGLSILDDKKIRQADIVHLHWINHGFLSLKQIDQLKKLNKPIFWTLHDMWACTGGCHYSKDCNGFQHQCGNCFYLKKPGREDLSHRVWKRKKHAFQGLDLHIIACSSWLAEKAKKSTLLSNFPIHTIPNPINTNVFYPVSKHKARLDLGLEGQKKYILFGAAHATDPRKGLSYLYEACRGLFSNIPVELLVLGEVKQAIEIDIDIPIRYMGRIDEEAELIKIYNAATLIVTPSLEDNLPNMIMESMACGTPAVGFHVGGIPEMIHHKLNGYVAEYKDTADLRKGMEYVLNHTDYASLAQRARDKVIKTYHPSIVSVQYIDFYKRALRER